MKTTFLRPVLDVDATGAKIKSLMKQRGITPRQLQIILNFPYVQTVYNWFSGKNMPTIDNLIVLAQVLGVTVDDIIVTKTVDIEIEDMQGVEALIA
ncbi:MAG: helix-turn-helix transcriptional regulator [Treponema sp.]|nr:helix-turn-helix transcriptional regulator [Treponema sp.]MBQ1643547.1 helix-turn-helix transcriptional regulator [Treponema sp.]MBQ1795427.1 helix-turn-helix transcriptional regulator [Treponema sp.]MBQ1870026.1 helix-turn-helix transcriptional regulator [Treponema sp.]MBQ2207415.1 helix-turn-helix transcriptional regulator [Treponema sp.]